MNDIVTQILDNSSALSEFTLKKGPNCTEVFLNDGTGKEYFYTLLPGMTLAYIFIDSPIWPESTENVPLKPLRFNYCVSGRGELFLDDDSYMYLKENGLCLSRQASKKDYIFPTGHYRGLSIYFDLDLLHSTSRQILETFGLDFSRIQDLYCGKKDTYIDDAAGEIRTILEKIWTLPKPRSPFYMKLYVLEFLHALAEKESIQPKNCIFYTGIQVELAKKTAEILTADLRRHIPIRFIAKQFSVSESSLRNYFQGVYGQNTLSYLREQRMKAAAELLTETRMSVSETAQQVGYTNQGKFAAVFKQYWGMSPLEYRRTMQLKNVENH